VSTKTFSPRPRDIERRWYVVDADGAVLGRLASEVAKILRGKHKPIFAPHADTGDHVIVVNARGVRLTGGKEGEKVYWRHSGYPGGIRGIGYAQLLAKRPALAVEKAVKGMLPKNRLGHQMFGKLAVYEGPEHPHQAQKPAPLGIGEIPPWAGLPKPEPKRAPRPKEVGTAKGRSTAGRPKRATAPARRSSSVSPARKARTPTAAKRATARRRPRAAPKETSAAGPAPKASRRTRTKAKKEMEP
jgi:large subunit ribosomal protein L13